MRCFDGKETACHGPHSYTPAHLCRDLWFIIQLVLSVGHSLTTSGLSHLLAPATCLRLSVISLCYMCYMPHCWLPGEDFLPSLTPQRTVIICSVLIHPNYLFVVPSQV